MGAALAISVPTTSRWKGEHFRFTNGSWSKKQKLARRSSQAWLFCVPTPPVINLLLLLLDAIEESSEYSIWRPRSEEALTGLPRIIVPVAMFLLCYWSEKFEFEIAKEWLSHNFPKSFLLLCSATFNFASKLHTHSWMVLLPLNSSHNKQRSISSLKWQESRPIQTSA